MNVWHRVMFDALDSRDGERRAVAVADLLPAGPREPGHGDREYLLEDDAAARVAQLAERARAGSLAEDGRYYQLNLMQGDHSTPEYRVADDLRLSVDAPVDLVLGIFAAVISAITFIGVLWFIGGDLEVPIGAPTLRIPGFLVIAAVIYSVLASGAMVYIARGFVLVAENKNQAEADYRYALTRLRENGESIALLGGDAEERAGLESAFDMVRNGWRAMMMQSIRTTIVAEPATGSRRSFRCCFAPLSTSPGP